MSGSKHWNRAVVYLILVAGAAAFILPFYWMFATSIKTYDEVFAIPPVWWPASPQWINYVRLMHEIPFARYTLNTVFVTGLSLVGYIVSSAIVAFGFSFFEFKGKSALFKVLLMTMMLPPQVTMIPQFVLFRKLGWVGTFLPLVIPPFFGGAFAIFLLKQFFDTIPHTFADAAKLDGATAWDIFLRIYVPLSKPAIATASLFIFIWTWTDFLNPLIYLNDDRLYTLAIGLQQFATSRTVDWPLLMAGSLLMTLPILVLFFMAHKTFIQGIQVGGVKF